MAIERFKRTLVGIVLTSVAFGFLYFMVLSFAITLGEAELSSDSPLLAVRDTLMFLATVFGFPFMRLFGSNSAAILGLIALNSLLWGPLLFFGFRLLRARLERGRLTSA